MDFGFGRFLEMFEERFGRRTTTVLLAIIGLGVFGFCLSLIYTNIIGPAYALWVAWAGGGAPFHLTAGDIAKALISGLSAGIIIWLLALMIGRALHKKQFSTIQGAIDKAEDLHTNIKTIAGTVTEQLAAVHKLTEETAALRAEAAELLGSARNIRNQSAPAPTLEISFNETTAGCRVPTTFGNGRKAVFFRVLAKNSDSTPIGCNAFLVDIKKRDMNGDFVPTGFAERLALTWAAEGSAGPLKFGIIYLGVPKFLDILCVSEDNKVAVATENFFWPNSVKGLFDLPGVYLLEIAVTAHNNEMAHLKLVFQWSGKWDEAKLSMQTKGPPA